MKKVVMIDELDFKEVVSALRRLRYAVNSFKASYMDGGLSRTVTVYSYSGDEIASWSGKFDVTENDQETYFDIDGRRIIIQGGIIINEEEPDK